jgi:hypothetical protein
MTTFFLNKISWVLLPAFIILLIVIALVARFIPRQPIFTNVSVHPKWDLPARMIVATTFVALLTTFANILGPQLSGLISTFPIFGVVFAAFTHSQQGANAAANLLRGVTLGSVSYAFFFLIVGSCLTHFGIALTYIMALSATISVSGIFYFITQREKRQAALE